MGESSGATIATTAAAAILNPLILHSYLKARDCDSISRQAQTWNFPRV